MNVPFLILATALNLVPGEFDVVISPKASGPVLLAAEEMTNFLSRSLGTAIPIRTSFDLRRKAIVLGTNAWSVAAGVDVSPLRRDGFRMKTLGDALYIAGRDDSYSLWHVRRNIWFSRGTMMGVYAFLEDFVGCRFYFPGELGEIVPKRNSIAIPELDRSDQPAMEARRCSYHTAGEWYDSEEPDKGLKANLNIYRLRLGSQKLITCHGLRGFRYGHRFIQDHPEYFCLQKNGERYLVDTEKPPYSKNCKLCFSSAVREEIYQDVKAYLTGQSSESRGLERWGSACRDRLYVGIHPEDGYRACQCDKCQSIYRKESPSYASELIWGLTKEISERLTAEGIDAVLMQSAYSAWSRVPDFELPKNILLDAATHGPWGTATEEGLSKDLAKLKAWSEKVGHPILNWTYPGKYGSANNPRNEDVPQVTPHAYAKYYQAAAKYITGPNAGSYAESASDRWMFNMLNIYVFSRIAWNPAVDVEAILDEHYRLMYGAGASQMKDFFEALEKTWMSKIQGKTVDTSIGPVTLTPSSLEIWADLYSPARLDEFGKLFAKADAAVPSGSLESQRIALMKREFLDRMIARGRSVLDEVSVDREKTRRAADPPESILPNFKEVAIAVKSDETKQPFKAVKYAVNFRPGKSYRISYFVKGENVRPFARRGGANAVAWMNEATDDGKACPAVGFSGTFDWVHHAEEFHVSKNPPVGFKPEIDLRLYCATGKVWFDGLVVEEIKR